MSFRGLAILVLVYAVALLGCDGPAGPQGEPGPAGTSTAGDAGPPGAPGTDGDAGAPGSNAYLTGPGLSLEILDVTIHDGAPPAVTFRITDASGLPLDRAGVYTEGAVSASFVLAWLDQTSGGDALQYTAYTTETQTSPITLVSAAQAAADAGGTFADVDPLDGTYLYTFGAPITITEPDRTHTLGAWATRPYQDATYVANALHDFLPSGGAPVVKREIVETAACNACHDPLEAHGGERRDARLCVLCHSPQTIDPDTGNTVDFPVMVHRIHRGKDLPSVVAGVPYQIIGFMQEVNDYSTVGYPQEIQRCDGCHTGPQGDRWKTAPSRVACASCHDRTWLDPLPVPAGWTAHAGGPQPDDTNCKVCHPPIAGLADVTTSHLTPTLDPASPALALAITSVEQTAPGETPEIVFTVQENGAPLDILASPLTRLAVTVAGPTTDYASYATTTLQGSGATGSLVAEGVGYRYTFPAPMDASAAGTYAFGLEGYLEPSGDTGPRYSAPNAIAFAAVTDPAPVPRREVVATAQCNNCHYQLAAHGGQRNDTRYCVLCHNPNSVNDQGVSRFEGQTVTARSLNLPVMIHGIHMGDALTQQPYVLGGYPLPSKASPAGTPIDFGEVRYPGDRKACPACHAGATYTLPLADGLLPSLTEVLTCTEDPAADADDYCDTRAVTQTTVIPPTQAACTGCHDAPYVVAHAQTMTAASGVEACATCHGPGTDDDVQGVHARLP